MRIPFFPKKKNNGKPKRPKQRTLSSYEQSQQRRNDYRKRLKEGL